MKHSHDWRLSHDLERGPFLWCRTCPKKIYKDRAPKLFSAKDRERKEEMKRVAR